MIALNDLGLVGQKPEDLQVTLNKKSSEIEKEYIGKNTQKIIDDQRGSN